MAARYKLPKAPTLYNDSSPTLKPGEVYYYDHPDLDWGW